MYIDPDPKSLAPWQSLEIGQECPFFWHANLATLFVTLWVKVLFIIPILQVRRVTPRKNSPKRKK